MPQADIVSQIKTDLGIAEPSMFKIIYLNDNTTTVEFVMDTLVEFFDYNAETAARITQDIHHEGSAVVAVLPYEVAEQKGIEVTLCARNANYPLQIKLEPEEN